MGRRYYCEYCDKSFLDDFQAREKHIKGSLHQRMRKQHYDSFRDPEAILADESAKDTCKRFRQTGECPFGDACRYTHYSPQDLRTLQNYIEEEQQRKAAEKSVFQYKEPGPQLSSWLQKRSSLPESSTQASGSNTSYVWIPPPALRDIPDLPPSLQPVTIQDFKNVEFTEWG